MVSKQNKTGYHETLMKNESQEGDIMKIRKSFRFWGPWMDWLSDFFYERSKAWQE
jgi:hypothetical protein